MESPLQLEAGKLPPVPRAGFAAGGEAEGGRAEARYVHNIDTSSQAVAFRGTSNEGVELQRDVRREKLVRRVINSLNRAGFEKKAKELKECGAWFDVWIHPNGDRKLVPFPCGSIFCPSCANLRSRRLQKKLLSKVNRADRSYWSLTLTVPNIERLDKFEVLSLMKNWSKLWKSSTFQSFAGEKGELLRIYGAVRSVEVTYNVKSQSWHPHLHVLFEAPRKLPLSWLDLLKAAWSRLNGCDCYVHLDRAYSRTKRGEKKFGKLNRRAIREFCKYVTKSADFADDYVLVGDFVRAFESVRRIQGYGSFLGEDSGEPEGGPGEFVPDLGHEGHSLGDRGYFRFPIRVHVSQCVCDANGQLCLGFDFEQVIERHYEINGPPWELTPEPVVSTEQKRIEFAGAMPEKSERQSSLFDVAD